MQFVEEIPSKVRTTHNRYDEVASTLQENPNLWGVVEEGVPVHRGQVVRTALERRSQRFEVKYRNGTVYARYVEGE